MFLCSDFFFEELSLCASFDVYLATSSNWKLIFCQEEIAGSAVVCLHDLIAYVTQFLAAGLNPGCGLCFALHLHPPLQPDFMCASGPCQCCYV